MVNSKNIQMDMTTRPFTKKLIRFSLPIFLTTILQFLYSSADLAIVGKFSNETLSLSAIGATNPITNLFTGLFIGLSVGANIVVAQSIGAKRYDIVEKAVHTSIFISVVFGIFGSLISIPFSSLIMKFMNIDGKLLKLSTTYLIIILSGLTFSLVYNFGSAILRAVGDSKRPLIILTISGLINIILNVFFVCVLKMDVDGVAIATITSQFISAVLVIICLIRTDTVVKFSFKKISCDRLLVKKIAYIGLIAGIQSLLFNITNIIVQKYLIKLGEIYPGISATQFNVTSYISSVATALSQGAVAFVSQNYGANNLDNVKKIYLTCQIIGFIGTLIFEFIIILFRIPILNLFNDSQEFIEIAEVGLIINTIGYVFWTGTDITVGALKGINSNIPPTIITTLFVCVFRILYFIFIFPIYPNYNGVMVIYPISWLLVCIAQIICFIKTYKKLKGV